MRMKNATDIKSPIGDSSIPNELNISIKLVTKNLYTGAIVTRFEDIQAVKKTVTSTLISIPKEAVNSFRHR